MPEEHGREPSVTSEMDVYAARFLVHCGLEIIERRSRLSLVNHVTHLRRRLGKDATMSTSSSEPKLELHDCRLARAWFTRGKVTKVKREVKRPREFEKPRNKLDAVSPTLV